MKPPKALLRRVIEKTISPTELIAEIRSFAPLDAQRDRNHSWWKVEFDELLDILIQVANDNVYLTAPEAVIEARRTGGRVVTKRISGLVLHRVLPVEEAEIDVIDSIVAEAMPSEFVEPTWDADLPSLETFRLLAERQYLQRLLAKHDFNITASAVEAEVSRQSFYGLLQRHGITRPSTTEQQRQVPHRKVA